MSEIISFKIESEHASLYEATFRLNGRNLTAWCNCPKGELGQYCVHVLSILLGEGKGVVGDNADKVEIVRSWVNDTDVGEALILLAKAEMALENARVDVEKAKDRVAQAIRD